MVIPNPGSPSRQNFYNRSCSFFVLKLTFLFQINILSDTLKPVWDILSADAKKFDEIWISLIVFIFQTIIIVLRFLDLINTVRFQKRGFDLSCNFHFKKQYQKESRVSWYNNQTYNSEKLSVPDKSWRCNQTTEHLKISRLSIILNLSNS